MENILCPDKEVHWAITKKDILIDDFTAEARHWLNIICSRVLSCTYITTVTDMGAWILACLLSSVTLNIGQIVISELRNFTNHEGTLLLFLSLITELSKRVQVEECVKDTWVHPGPRTFPLKFLGEVAPSQSKKRKVDSGISTQEDTDSCMLSSFNPLDDISGQIWVVQELLSRLPHGTGDFSTAYHSYMAQSDYEIYQVEKKKLGAKVSSLDKAYSSLAISHRDLKESQKKMVKREKKGDIFFRKL